MMANQNVSTFQSPIAPAAARSLAAPLRLLRQVGKALLLAALLLLAAGAARADGVVPRRIVLHINAATDKDAAQIIAEIESELEATLESHLAGTNIYALQIANGDDENEIASELGADSRVVWAETDTYFAAPEDLPDPALPVVSGDPFHFPFDITSGPGTYLTQSAYQQIDLGAAQTLATGQGVIVAVLDTGVTAGHAALVNRVLPGYNALNSALPPDDAADGATNVSVGHGTMIAGLIAAVAPGAKILPVRVLNGDGVGSALGVAQGISYAVAHGARVINLSLSSAQPSRALAEAIHAALLANVLIVTAAGNGGTAKACYPAALPDAMAISSVESSGAKSGYASFGPNIAIVAPGSGLRSAYAGGYYALGSGTSFAAPLVSAAAALLFSRQPKATVKAVRSAISQTARPVNAQNPLYAGQLGAGILDIQNALRAFKPTLPTFYPVLPVLLSPADAMIFLPAGGR